MFTLDDKEYDETKLSQEGQFMFAQLQNIAKRKGELTFEFENLNVLAEHWTKKLKEALPKEEDEKVETKEQEG